MECFFLKYPTKTVFDSAHVAFAHMQHFQDANWLRVGSPQKIIKVMNFNRALMYESLLKTKFECYSKRKYIYLACLGMRFYYHERILERIFKYYSQVKY